MDAVAQALADPIRRRILCMLRVQAMTAGAIASEFDVSRPAISRHLRVLREAELVRDEVSGREREYRLTPAPLRPLVQLATELMSSATPWERRFDALETEVARVRRNRQKVSASRTMTSTDRDGPKQATTKRTA